MYIRNYRRHAAAPKELFFGLSARESSFDDVNGGRRHVVFGAQSDDRAAAMKNVADQLEGRPAHQAVRVDAKSNVINKLATVDRLGDHELFVFRPGEPGGQLGSVIRGACDSPRLFEQAPDHGMKSI